MGGKDPNEESCEEIPPQITLMRANLYSLGACCLCSGPSTKASPAYSQQTQLVLCQKRGSEPIQCHLELFKTIKSNGNWTNLAVLLCDKMLKKDAAFSAVEWLTWSAGFSNGLKWIWALTEVAKQSLKPCLDTLLGWSSGWIGLLSCYAGLVACRTAHKQTRKTAG